MVLFYYPNAYFHKRYMILWLFHIYILQVDSVPTQTTAASLVTTVSIGAKKMKQKP